MASKTLALSFLLCLNLIFFTLVSSNYVPCPPPPPSGHDGHHGGGSPGGPTTSPPPSGHGGHHGGGPPGGSTTPTPPGAPGVQTPPAPSKGGQCPINVLKLQVCGNVLNGLLNVVLGVPPKSDCCSLLQGLTDLDAAICLCTAIEADVLGIHLDVPVSLSVLLNYCGKAGTPSGFQCPSTPSPATPTPATPTPKTPTPVTPTPKTPTPVTPTPKTPSTPTTPTPAPSKGGKCPTNILKLQVCGNVLNGLLNVVLGAPPKSECCSLLQGLTDLDAAICLCTAIEADVLGIHLDVPVSLSVLLNYCGKAGVPSDFQCPSSPTTPTPTPATPTPAPYTPTPTPATPAAPTTPSTPAPSMGGKCPTNILKLQVCGNVLNGLLNVVLGGPPKSECCSLLQGLTDLDAAICLCTAIQADVLGIQLDVPVSLSLLLNYCGKAGAPSGFQCPA